MITVAEFILRAIRRRKDFEVRVISLATSSRDPCSLLLSRPSTWLRGVTTRVSNAHGEDFIHVGAHLGEIEFRRLSARRELAHLLADCDLIQVVAGTPAWAWPVIGLGKPVVLQVATMTATERRMRARLDRGPLRFWRAAMTLISDSLDHAVLPRLDAVLVENPWMLNHVRQTIGPALAERVRYAPPGVDADAFHPPRYARAGRGYVLSVGRFADKRKNSMLLLRAYARLRLLVREAPDLVLAGADAPSSTFWNAAETLGVRQFITFQPHPSNGELARLYRDATCFALSSDEEGFGMVVIEAMASGLPVVATRCGGPDGIIEDGVDGYLVARDDEIEMSERLARIVQDPRAARAMGDSARHTVETRYADEIAGGAYLDVYDALLALGAR